MGKKWSETVSHFEKAPEIGVWVKFFLLLSKLALSGQQAKAEAFRDNLKCVLDMKCTEKTLYTVSEYFDAIMTTFLSDFVYDYIKITLLVKCTINFNWILLSSPHCRRQEETVTAFYVQYNCSLLFPERF